ncbi:O-antigen ligase family protein [Crateriforma spongiae]|uniref:O-antigen ligase family protein n=1 Tax=Crateriforma spongiae TaxID=2724528 RepID=UPI0039B07A6E
MNSVIILITAVVVLASLIHTYRNPWFGFVCALLVYGYEQWTFAHSSFFVRNPQLMNLAAGVIALVGLFSVYRTKPRSLALLPTSYFLSGAFYILSIASYFWAVSPTTTVEHFTQWLPYIVLYVFICPLLITCTDDFEKSCRAFVLIGAGLLALLAFTTQTVGRGQAVVGTDTTINPLCAATLGGQLSIIAILTCFRDRTQAWLILRIVVMILALYICVRSGSRGQLLGIAIVVPYFLYVSRQNAGSSRVIALLVLLSIAAYFIVSVALPDIQASQTRWTIDAYRQTRGEMSKYMIEAWHREGGAAYLIGLGSNASSSSRYLGYYPHVTVVQALTELGIVGLIAWISIIAKGTFDYRSELVVAGKSIERRSTICCLGALMCYEFILTFKQYDMLINVNVLMFSIIIGRSAIARQSSTKRIFSSEYALTRPVSASA